MRAQTQMFASGFRDYIIKLSGSFPASLDRADCEQPMDFRFEMKASSDDPNHDRVIDRAACLRLEVQRGAIARSKSGAEDVLEPQKGLDTRAANPGLGPSVARGSPKSRWPVTAEDSAPPP